MSSKVIFQNLSENPSLAIFDARQSLLKRLAKSEDFKRFTFHSYSLKEEGFDCKRYNGSEEVNQNSGEITALHRRSLLNGLAKYPYRSKYVLYKFSPFSIFFYLGLLGLLRRYVIGLLQDNNRLSILGVRKLTGNPLDLYLVIRNPNSRFTNHFSISGRIGYKGFLEFLNSSGKKYSVIRFFEKLPERYREDGDLDLLVEDDLFIEASNFLSNNAGSEMVDMYSVTGPANAAKIPYYTPYLAKKILSESVSHNGYSVPKPEHYLNSFIYHCLYHKGLSSGITTKYPNLEILKTPDNDYLQKIRELSEPLNIDVGETLEELDLYMKSVGWRPHLDTLELLSSNNKWVETHIKTLNLGDELCIVGCVLKKGFFENHRLEIFEEELKSLELEVVNKEILEGDRSLTAYNHLRGGNWSATNEAQYSPAVVYILVDKSKDAFLVRENGLGYNPRPKKKILRKLFDRGSQSHIHMTDNTFQTLEYIDVLYPKKLESFKRHIIKVDSILKSQKHRSNHFYIFLYKIKTLPRKLKDRIMEFLRALI